MPTADELINALTEGTEITIDPVTRLIDVPISQRLFGVESDQTAERRYFRCPKIVGDDLDLSTYDIYVNYRNTSGAAASYLVEDAEADGNDLTFSWLLSRAVTSKAGEIEFSVCCKKTDTNGNLTSEWNTTINKDCTCLAGLEATAEILQTYPDVINQMVNQLKAGGLESDKTLSIAGAAADAKAVGDALALKADTSALASYLKTADAGATYATKTALNSKADASALTNYLTTAIAQSTYATKTEVAGKADATALSGYWAKTELQVASDEDIAAIFGGTG